VQVTHRLTSGSAVFNDEHLVSCVGLVPVMRLAEQTGLGRLLDEKVCVAVPPIRSGPANPAGKLAPWSRPCARVPTASMMSTSSAAMR
jgi:hypothetical protein